MSQSVRRNSHQKFLLGVLFALGASHSAGCASMKSPGSWFSGSKTTDTSSTWTQSIAGTGKGIGNQFKSLGTTMTSAVGKAKTAVVSKFSPKGDGTVDPQTSLADMPTALGAEIWVTNGQVFEMKGNYAAAMDNYTKALEKEPDNLAALESVARLQMRQEQYPQAIESYQKVVKVSPTAEHYAELAGAEQKAGRLNDAKASIQKAISMDSSTPRYRNNLAGILVSMGRSDEAVKELQNVFPPAVSNYNVAYLHFMNKNMAATQQHLQLALQSDPNLQEARDLLNTINQSQAGQSAVAAYDVGSQIYRTAQGKPTTGQPNQTFGGTGQTVGGTTQGYGATQGYGGTTAQTVGGTTTGNAQAPSYQYSQLPSLPTVNR